MLKDDLWDWIRLVEVVSRLTLTYLVRDPEQIAKYRQRDRGVEYWLTRWYKDGTLAKHPVYPYVAYYLPTGKPGIRGNLAHDLFASLAAAKLFADLKGSVQVRLARQKLDRLDPDWMLEARLEGVYRYFLEFHSERNKHRNLLDKLAAYNNSLGENEWLLVVCQKRTYAQLSSEQMMLTTLKELLVAANSWTDPIWHWGEHDGRFGLLSG